MGHEQSRAGPDLCVLHLMEQEIIEYYGALWRPLMLQMGMQRKDCQSTVNESKCSFMIQNSKHLLF